MIWSTVRSVAALSVLLCVSASAAAPSTGAELSTVLANPSDWRAIAGLLAFMWVVSTSTLVVVLRSTRIERQVMFKALTADTEAKTSLANAMISVTAGLSRIQSFIDSREP